MVSQKTLTEMPSFCQTKNILSVAVLKLKYFKDIKHCEIETCWRFFCALFCLTHVVGLLYFSKARTDSVRQNHISRAKSVCICWSAKIKAHQRCIYISREYLDALHFKCLECSIEIVNAVVVLWWKRNVTLHDRKLKKNCWLYGKMIIGALFLDEFWN